MAERQELAGKGMTLAWWAQEVPDHKAIISPTGDRTFAELNANANKVVRALRKRGLADGDAVALMCTNRPAFVETWAACLRAGFRLTTINWHLTGEEAGYIVDDCEAKALVVDSSLLQTAREAAALAANCTVRLAVGVGSASEQPTVSGASTTGAANQELSIDSFESYNAAIAAEDGGDIDDATPGSQMLYTSGTTGRPKGVYRPPAQGAAAAAQASVNLWGYQEGSAEDLHICTGPLYHAAPLAFSLAAPLAYGVGVVLMEKWDAEEALRLIAEHKITHTHMVPTMFHRLISLPEDVRAKYDTSSLRHVLHGAAPCPVPVKQALIDWLGPVVVEYYAATEGVGSFVDSNTWLTKPGTVGKPFGEGQVIIGDEDGNEVARDTVGLVYIKAPEATRFQYYKDDEKTKGSFRGEYFTLGDMGYMDADGFLFLTDRTANLIISGGVNIYPAEVDAVLLEHPAVGDAATIGVPNSEWGEEVKAVVELQPGIEPTPELASELLEFCRGKLAGFKCPRSLDFVDELPRQDNGKIYKRLLRDRYRDAAATEGVK
ncbi:MAG TPA: AMP-binding protein [Acidimicrobiales bacterium]|nr:AMP-binding protein [Acidimicrobiales bacterium]